MRRLEKLKKKKLTSFNDSGVGILDNTAPVKKILDDLYLKNPTAHRFYCQVVGRRPASVRATHCCLVGHNLAAFPDSWDGELPLEYNEAFTYKATLPRMLLPPKHLDARDPVTELLELKNEWSVTYQRMIAASQFTKDVGEYRQLTDDVSHCPQHYINMAAHLQREPSPRFRSHFDWTRAGRGTLHILVLQQRRYLVHAVLTCLNVSLLSDDEMVPNVNETFTFDCGDNILEATSSEESQIIALRALHKVTLLKLTHSDGVGFQVLKTFESKVQYTSVEFDPHHQSVLYITTLDDTVDIVNLNALEIKTVILNEKPMHVDNWNTVQGLDRVHYVHVTAQAIHVFDKRTHKKAYSIANHKKVCEDCNSITVARKSERLPHCLYFGTNHHLFCADVRSQKNVKPKLLSRWTHGMRCPPTLLSVTDFEVGKEAVFLSSQWPEDTTVVVNDAAHSKAGLPIKSMFLPYKPPCIFEAIENARTMKLCLDPTLKIDKRASTCITGLCVKENHDRFEILTQNSLGDVSLQTLYPEHHDGFIATEFPLELHTWANSLRVPPATLTATDIVNVSTWWAFNRLVSLPDETRTTRERSKVNFTEEAVVELFEAEDFDDDLLQAWNIT